ncbi:hypothetical protein SARC_01953 [Sphaeroforma arctica JP610]|uniref:Uncharacterized protein n=1 Tax=Sphaeroforma arctica JP610 TaxID=667725 RepID=A0A0L0GA14_9EUKA|nr:hypothetical protein SARC_01953 [Sphaeroforma arctica JP610]KNC85877.1 hypothetical protein SARC_01953 [Sphaeroforma arctica JP610]|eukprot:XP_014159779.1 hypothetical protein SARC_01953 [Sphaeroforma arctica JP610]
METDELLQLLSPDIQEAQTRATARMSNRRPHNNDHQRGDTQLQRATQTATNHGNNVHQRRAQLRHVAGARHRRHQDYGISLAVTIIRQRHRTTVSNIS